jgi:transcriptional regulator with AAA-type ATPase domain
MGNTKTLSEADREFFTLMSQAASCNPFSDEYVELIGKLAGEKTVPPQEQLKLLVERVTDRVHKLEVAGGTDVRQYTEGDRAMLTNALLFDVYHRLISRMDQLILDQIDAGESPVPVKFAGEALALIRRCGFNAAEAVRYFAIFYQIRRAYFFIDRGLIGVSPCIQELRRQLWNSVFTHDIRWYDRYLWNRMEDFSTLLLGETGCGKGTAAAAIGRSGFIPFDQKKGCFAESFMRSFIALNLSQFPESLIESELFGHRKGAFTGAVEEHEGVFARCSPHGAIFLDEIGDVSIPVQIKLLQVLQERTFTPVGSHEKRRFQGRVIAATNKPISQLRASGQFRDDFYYRLCSQVITVPPLRQRIAEDSAELEQLLASIVERLTGETSAVELVRDTLRKTLGNEYPWTGNVRELEQAARSILLTRQYAGDHRGVATDLRSQLVAGVESGALDADALLAGYCRLLYERHGTYEEVARRANLDRRTVKAYLEKHIARRPCV